MSNTFDAGKLEKLNNPQRLKAINPDYIWGLLKLEDPTILVDIGAGTGLFSIEFSKKLDSCTIYACDISEVMINWMNKNILPSNPSIKTILLHDSKLPIQDNKADLVFMITLHHELVDTKSTLEESYRVLKDGGKILIVDWKKNEFKQGPAQEIRVTPEEVKTQLEENGFKNFIIDSTLDNFFITIAEK